MNTNNEKAYVLHTRDYRESSQLVDLFSRDFGRFRAVAKRVRGKRKSSSNKLQAFTLLSLSWRGKGELKNLTMIEPSANSAALHGESLYVGLYLNELLVRLLPEHVPHEHLFDSYSVLLAQLEASADLEPLLRRFELQLLDEIGYGLDMTIELGADRPIVAGEHYHFTHDQGFVRLNTLSPQGNKACFEGAHLLAIAKEDYQTVAVRRSAKRLLRCALGAQLGDRPLLSRQLFNQPVLPVARGKTAKGE